MVDTAGAAFCGDDTVPMACTSVSAAAGVTGAGEAGIDHSQVLTTSSTSPRGALSEEAGSCGVLVQEFAPSSPSKQQQEQDICIGHSHALVKHESDELGTSGDEDEVEQAAATKAAGTQEGQQQGGGSTSKGGKKKNRKKKGKKHK